MLGIVAVIVGAFTIANALSMSVAQQQRSLALLRAVGASRRQVRGLVALQALSSASSARVLGLAGGFAHRHAIGALFDVLGLGLPMTSMALTSGGVIAAAIVIGIGVPLLAARRPARLATRISPVSAMREASTSRVPACSAASCAAIASVRRPPGRAVRRHRRLARAPQRDAPSGPHRGDRRGADDRRHAGRGRRRHRRRAQGLGLKTEADDRITADLVVGERDAGLGPDVAADAAARRGGQGRASRRLAGPGPREARQDRGITVDGLDAGAAKMLHHDVVTGRRPDSSGRGVRGEDARQARGLHVGAPLELTAANGKRVSVTVAGITRPGQAERRRPR